MNRFFGGWSTALVMWAATCALGCPATSTDRFVPAKGGGTAIGQWATTSDGRLRVPLSAGLAWQMRVSQSSLLEAGAPEGPTFVVVAIIGGTPQPTRRETCAETHRTQLMVALAKKGIAVTTPQITLEPHEGEQVPRLHYAVPLEAHGDAKPASMLSSWGYVIDGVRCLGIGVTTIVHAKDGTNDVPDPEDMQRLEQVFEIAINGAELVPQKSPQLPLPR